MNTYGLKTVRRCSVPVRDGEAVYFVLCAPEIRLDNNRLDQDFELSVSFGGEGVLRRSLGLCPLIGAKLGYICSDSRESGEILAAFVCPPAAVPALICFFAIEADHFDVNGLINI